MSLPRKGLIGIPARPVLFIFNVAGGNPILLRCLLPAINDGVSIKYLARYGKSLTLSFRAGVPGKKQSIGVLTPFWSELIINYRLKYQDWLLRSKSSLPTLRIDRWWWTARCGINFEICTISRYFIPPTFSIATRTGMSNLTGSYVIEPIVRYFI